MQIVYIVDDDDISRNYLCAVVSAAQIPCRIFASAEAFLLDYDEQQPGCLLLDMRMPGMSGLDLQQHLNRRCATVPIVFISGHAEVPEVVEALLQGAFGFLQKSVSNEALVMEVRKALEHDAANRAELLGRARLHERFQSLTPREHEVLKLLMAGHSNKAMANELVLSQRTVELHRARVMEKTGASSLAQLIQMAAESQGATGARPALRRPTALAAERNTYMPQRRQIRG